MLSHVMTASSLDHSVIGWELFTSSTLLIYVVTVLLAPSQVNDLTSQRVLSRKTISEPILEKYSHGKSGM